MKTFISTLPSLCVLLFLALFTAGCAQNRQAIARLEQENAQQRERIWQSNRKMEDFRQENESLRQQLAALQNRNSQALRSNNTYSQAVSPSSTGNSWTAAPSQPQTTGVVQSVPMETVPGTSAVQNQPITAQPPESSLGKPSSAQTLPTNPPSGSQVTMGTGNRQIHVKKTDSRNVHSVMILPEKAKAIHYEGLHAEFQMRDAAGNIVLAPAPVVVMVTDPSKTGEESKISKWNYTAEDVADIINSGQAALSVPLNMAWAKSCPQNLNLELHILYYTSDKRMLMHRAKINLTSPSVAAAPQGGLTLETANPAVGSNAQPLSKPEWGPNP